MAQADFKLSAPVVINKEKALESAKQKDSRSVNFRVPADTDEILILTGNFVEIPWTRGKGNQKTEGTILAVEAKRKDEKLINVPFGFFRTKRLTIGENEYKTFEACFPREASFEEIVNSIEKDKKIKVVRSGYLFPGRSSERDVDTVVWAE